MKYLYKTIRIILVLLGVGLGAIAGRPLPLWRLLPVLLVGLSMMGSGCAKLNYTTPNMKVSGFTTSPGSVIAISANAEVARAEAYAIKKCVNDVRYCGAIGAMYGGMWGYGGLDVPAGYTLAGMQAAGVGTTGSANSSLEQKLDESLKETRKTSAGLKEFFRVRGQNSKHNQNAPQ